MFSKLRSLIGGRSNAPARAKPGSQYMRGEGAQVFWGWNPILRDAREDVRAAYWRSAARTIDVLHNSGWLAGVVQKGVSSVLGKGLRLALKPDFEAIGWDQKQSSDWARLVERRFEGWASDPLECDASGKFDLSQLASAAVRSHFGPGEWTAWMRWIERSCSTTATKIMLLPAHRMTQESNGVDLFQGVRIDADGLPASYRFRLTQPILETGQIVELRARDSANRTIVKHCFEGDIGQMRGISPFAPVLQVLRQFDQLANATLSTALLQALFAATTTSPAPTQDILAAFETADEQGVGGSLDGYMEARAGWHDKTKIDLGGLGRIAHLFPGEELKFLRSETPNSNYEPFARWLLREIAACGGFTFEDVTGDYTGATYSSIKMATTTNWPIQLRRRKHIAAPLYQTALECWLEEEVEAGRIEFPGGIEHLRKARKAACRAKWLGPAKPIPDEIKFAAANQTLYGLGATTLEQICADMGLSWEDVLEQLARERDKRKELGLPEPAITAQAEMMKAAMSPDEPPKKGKKDDA